MLQPENGPEPMVVTELGMVTLTKLLQSSNAKSPMTVTELGNPMRWSRNVLAQVIHHLNCDEENRPAVIGIDLMLSEFDEETPKEYDVIMLVPDSDDELLIWMAVDGNFYREHVSIEEVEPLLTRYGKSVYGCL